LPVPRVQDYKAKGFQAGRYWAHQQLTGVLDVKTLLRARLGRPKQHRLQRGPGSRVQLTQGFRRRCYVAGSQGVEGVADGHRCARDSSQAGGEGSEWKVVTHNLSERILHLQAALQLVAL